MTPRKRLSIAIKRAVKAARADEAAQKELHDAFEEVYGFTLHIEDLGGDELVDVLVYGASGTPSLSAFDAAVKRLKEEEDNARLS